MTWLLNSKEFASVSHLPLRERYAYFVKKVADWEELWSLWNDGWAVMGDHQGAEAVPVWPHRLFAETAAVADWSAYAPRKISLEEWLENWTAGMDRDGRMVAVFPTDVGAAVTVTPNKLKEDLEAEASRY